jgi:hypothetical protein
MSSMRMRACTPPCTAPPPHCTRSSSARLLRQRCNTPARTGCSRTPPRSRCTSDSGEGSRRSGPSTRRSTGRPRTTPRLPRSRHRSMGSRWRTREPSPPSSTVGLPIPRRPSHAATASAADAPDISRKARPSTSVSYEVTSSATREVGRSSTRVWSADGTDPGHACHDSGHVAALLPGGTLLASPKARTGPRSVSRTAAGSRPRTAPGSRPRTAAGSRPRTGSRSSARPSEGDAVRLCRTDAQRVLRLLGTADVRAGACGGRLGEALSEISGLARRARDTGSVGQWEHGGYAAQGARAAIVGRRARPATSTAAGPRPAARTCASGGPRAAGFAAVARRGGVDWRSPRGIRYDRIRDPQDRVASARGDRESNKAPTEKALGERGDDHAQGLATRGQSVA